MKTFKFVLLTIFLVSLFNSCSRENIAEELELSIESLDFTSAKIEHYVDGEYVGNSFAEKPDNYFAIQNNILDSEGKPLIQSIFFSKKDDYLKWGDENSVNLRGGLEFQAGVHKFLEDHPELLEIEDPNDIPEYYTVFEKQLRTEIYGEVVSNRAPISIIEKTCGGTASAVIPGTLPLMWWGWKHKTSESFGVYIGGAMNIFSKNWYQNHVITYVWFGGLDCWQGRFYDNTMASVAIIGL